MQSKDRLVALLVLTGCANLTPKQKKAAAIVGGILVVGAIAAHNRENNGQAQSAPPIGPPSSCTTRSRTGHADEHCHGRPETASRPTPRHGAIKAKCLQRVRGELANAHSARDQGFTQAVSTYVRSALIYRRLARQEANRH